MFAFGNELSSVGLHTDAFSGRNVLFCMTSCSENWKRMATVFFVHPERCYVVDLVLLVTLISPLRLITISGDKVVY